MLSIRTAPIPKFATSSPDSATRWGGNNAGSDTAGSRDKKEVNPSVSEAQAFDTGGLLKRILLTDRPTDRKALQASLLRLTEYDGITGKMRFDEHGEVKRKLLALTIEGEEEDRAIKLWEKTETPPEG